VRLVNCSDVWTLVWQPGPLYGLGIERDWDREFM
jgi:hypothetical protein